MNAEFNFYTIRVQVHSSGTLAEKVVESLQEDLRYFLSLERTSQIQPKIKIQIESHPVPFSGRKFCIFKTKSCQVYHSRQKRVCDYGNDAQVVASSVNKVRVFEVSGKTEAELYELSYLALLSSVGEELDLLGYHRIHALGVSFNEETALIPLPSGGGKSSIAVQLKDTPGFTLFSDEMPLIREGHIFPFPVRIALTPKVAQALLPSTKDLRTFKRKIYPAKLLIPIETEKVARPALLDSLLLVGLRPFSDFTFLVTTTLGLGLPQMAEHMLRFDNLGGLFKIALSRFKNAVWLLNSARVARFNPSRNAHKNAENLKKYLNSTKIAPQVCSSGDRS